MKKSSRSKPVSMTLEELKKLKSQTLEKYGAKEKLEEPGTSIKFKPNERL